ncbi:hypothetical protein PHMEG_0003144 [Phytophthora megakarya]|uniref:Uncharacterized protein n=1 Tax=Phytophthora megakarya TaxID=4795 RepID=A0A225WYP8_9STRA|nr:hypothetical protein PHMEG_0003144 [Phytophthora megakarya]
MCNIVGRYDLQYEVEYRTSAGAPLQRHWLDDKEHGALLGDDKLEDKLGEDGE